MTTQQFTTTPQRSTTEPEPIVTRDTAGILRCDCKRFKNNSIMFGEGTCDHTQAAEQAATYRNPTEAQIEDWADWLYEQANG